MKRTMILLLVLFTSATARAQLKPAEQSSMLTFTIKNLGFNVNGSFKGFDGTINFDPNNAAACSFDVSINAATVNTDNKLRDEHLRADAYFDVKNYPKISLTSNKISGKNGRYTFSGILTITGKSKAICFPFTAALSADGYVFKGSFNINRKDFGVGGTSTIADFVEVNLNVTAKNEPETDHHSGFGGKRNHCIGSSHKGC